MNKRNKYYYFLWIPQLNCKLYDYCILILFLLCVWLLLFRVKEEEEDPKVNLGQKVIEDLLEGKAQRVPGVILAKRCVDA